MMTSSGLAISKEKTSVSELSSMETMSVWLAVTLTSSISKPAWAISVRLTGPRGVAVAGVSLPPFFSKKSPYFLWRARRSSSCGPLILPPLAETTEFEAFPLTRTWSSPRHVAVFVAHDEAQGVRVGENVTECIEHHVAVVRKAIVSQSTAKRISPRVGEVVLPGKPIGAPSSTTYW